MTPDAAPASADTDGPPHHAKPLPPFDPRRALRRRTRLRLLVLLLSLGLLLSIYVSHRQALPDYRLFDQQRVHVLRVIDGDTLVIRTDDGRQERVRLRGVDAPELAHDDRPADYWADRSRTYLTARADQKQVILKIDELEPRDRYGRLLAFVYLEPNDCLNLDLVRDGQAYADRQFDSFLKSQLLQAENTARRKGTGLWKAVRVDQMPAWRQRWLATLPHKG